MKSSGVNTVLLFICLLDLTQGKKINSLSCNIFLYKF